MYLYFLNLFIVVVNGLDPCDIEKRSEGFQWTPVPNMRLCMYGYDPFEMDPLLPGQPDPGIKKQIFEPTVWNEEKRSMEPSPNVDYANDINCNIKQKTSAITTMTDLMWVMSGSFSFSETNSSSRNVPCSPLISYHTSTTLK